MEKKNKMSACVAALLGLVAALMIFAPAVSIEMMGESDSLSGIDVAFGYEEGGMHLIGFSATIATYVLLVVGVVGSLMLAFGKNNMRDRIFVALSFVAAGILYFCTKELINFYPDMESGLEKDLAKDIMKELLDLGIGSIIGGVLSLLAAVFVVAPLFLKEENKANTDNSDNTQNNA